MSLVFDRTARRIDADGRLHVTRARISKANVCPYYGREIPGAEALGLDANRIYQMYRDPRELESAGGTFNNIQLMQRHIAVSADKPQKERVVGSTGTNCCFEAPYLCVDLVIWDADAIRQIDNGEEREISCGYRYDPDMTPGEHEGVAYDGIMRNIVANHVALVSEGRAGPDVLVADQQIEGRKMKWSKKVLMARGAVAAYIKPLLATDAKIDYPAVFDGVTDANFVQMLPVVAGRLTVDTKEKLIQHASLKGLAAALDAVGEADCEDAEEDPDDGEKEEAKKTAASDKRAKDKAAKDKKAMDRKRARDAMSEEEREAYDAMSEEEREAADAEPTAPEKKPEGMDKATMDAAIQAGVSAGLAAMRALDAARVEVAPIVGDVHACDTAAKVYKFALDQMAVDTKGVDPSAFQAIFRLAYRSAIDWPRPMALDAGALDDDFFKDFPDARGIG